MNEDKIKVVASFNMNAEIEVVDIHCDNKENLNDYNWLWSSIPWTNHDGKMGKVTLTEPTEAHLITMDGYDKSTTDIEKIIFDNVIITSCHGFAGNSFTFEFKLGEKSVGIAYEYDRFAFTREEAKNRFIERLEQQIKGLEKQIDSTNSAINRIKNL